MTYHSDPNAAAKLWTPSFELGAIVGRSPLPYSEIIRRLWAYIKNNQLQVAEDRRHVRADHRLARVFGGPTFTMFDINKCLSGHLQEVREQELSG